MKRQEGNFEVQRGAKQMVDIENTRITLKGAEYLLDNHAMRKFAQIATDFINIVKP